MKRMSAVLAAALLLQPAAAYADNVGLISQVAEQKITEDHGAPVRVTAAPTNGQALVFNSTSGTWVAGTSSGPTTSTWAQVLVNGAASGATNPVLTDGQLFVFGAADASHPALKRSSTTIQVRYGDDSTDGGFQAGNYINAAAGGYVWTGRSSISSPADSVVLLQNNAQTDFGLLKFGGTTSSFPAIKRSTTGLQVRLADDSAFTTITTGRAWFTDSGTVPSGLTPFTASDFMISTSGATTVRQVAAGTSSPAIWTFSQSRGTIASPTANSSGDEIAWVNGQLYTGSAYAECARVMFVADGAPVAGSSAPGRISLMTVPSGSLTPVEQLRITASGNVVKNLTGAVLAQNATDGFVYVPVVNTGAPSGTPTSFTGNSALAVQGTTLYFYNGGWNSAATNVKTVTAKTTGYTLTTSDSSAVLTNAGASGSVTYTLPTWSAGLVYTFVVEATQTLQVTAPGSDTITIGTTTTAGGGSVSAGTQGYTLTLVATASGKWRAISVTGTWS